MFNKQEYINKYIKDNYKTIKVRIKKDDTLILNRLKEIDNVNKYILDLMRADAKKHKKYRYINGDIVIDFPVSKCMQHLIDKAEYADEVDDLGLYVNMADAIDTQAKYEVTRHRMSEGQWNKLIMRYQQ